MLPSTHISTSFFFFFNDTATTEIYTLSLHDALPISSARDVRFTGQDTGPCNDRRASTRRCSDPGRRCARAGNERDRKSTRLNSSHQIISYAVFCLKKKKRLRVIYTHTTYPSQL